MTEIKGISVDEWKEKICVRNATTRAIQGAARGLMTGRADSMRRDST